MSQKLPLLVNRIQYAAKQSMQQSIIDNMKKLRDDISRRKLYVLNEDSLQCDVNTDHLNPKSVLPIFDGFINDAEISLLQQPFDTFINQCNELITDQFTHYQQQQQAFVDLNDKYLQAVRRLEMVNDHLNKLMDGIISNNHDDKQKLIQQILYLQEQLYNKKYSYVYKPDFTGNAISQQGNSGGNPTDSLLEKQCKMQLERIGQLTSQIQNMQTQMQQLQQENLNKVSSSQVLNDNIKQLEDTISQYQAREEEFKKQEEFIQAIQHQIDQKDAQLFEAQQREQEIRGQMAKLRQEYENISNYANQDAEELRNELNHRNNQLNKYQEQVEQLQEKLKETRLQNQQLQEKYSEMKSTNAELITQSESTNIAEQTFNKTISEKDQLIANLEKEVANLKAQLSGMALNSMKSIKSSNKTNSVSFSKQNLRPELEDKEVQYSEHDIGNGFEPINLDNLSKAKISRDNLENDLASTSNAQDSRIEGSQNDTPRKKSLLMSPAETNQSRLNTSVMGSTKEGNDELEPQEIQLLSNTKDDTSGVFSSKYKHMLNQDRIIEQQQNEIFADLSPQRRQLRDLQLRLIQQQGIIDDLHSSQNKQSEIDQSVIEQSQLIKQYKQLLKEITKQDQQALLDAEEQLRLIMNHVDKWTQTDITDTSVKGSGRGIIIQDRGKQGNISSTRNSMQGSTKVNSRVDSARAGGDNNNLSLDQLQSSQQTHYQGTGKNVQDINNSQLYGPEQFQQSRKQYNHNDKNKNASQNNSNSGSYIRLSSAQIYDQKDSARNSARYVSDSGNSHILSTRSGIPTGKTNSVSGQPYHKDLQSQLKAEKEKQEALTAVNNILASRGMRPIQQQEISSIEDVYYQLQRRRNQYTTYFQQQRIFYKPQRQQTVTNVDLNAMFKDPLHDDDLIITGKDYRRGYMLVGNKLVDSDNEHEISIRMQRVIQSASRVKRRKTPVKSVHRLNNTRTALPQQSVNATQNILIISGTELSSPK